MSAPNKVYVHLLLADPKGAIKTASGISFRVACDETSSLPTHATVVASCVTCPLCQESPSYAELNSEQAFASSAERKLAAKLAADAQAAIDAAKAAETKPVEATTETKPE